MVMGSICLLSDGGLPSVSCVTHYSFVRSFVYSNVGVGPRTTTESRDEYVMARYRIMLWLFATARSSDYGFR